MKKSWTVSIGGETHVIAYQGRSIMRRVKLSVDGELSEYLPIRIMYYGRLVRLEDIGGATVILQLCARWREPELIVDGRYLDSGLAADDIASFSLLRARVDRRDILLRRITVGQRSYLLFVALALVSMAMILLGSKFFFSFTVFIPHLLLGLAGLWFPSYAAGAATAFASAGVFLLPCFLSKKWIAASAWLSLAFILADTAVLLWWVIRFDLRMIPAIVYHLWVLFALINLLRSRAELSKMPEAEAMAAGAAQS